MTPARTCTLLAGIRIERGAREDWDRLAPLHYRSHHAGAISDIFRMVHKPTRNEKGEGQRDEGTQGRRRLARGLPGSPPRLRGARRKTRNAAPRPCSGRPEKGRRAERGTRNERRVSVRSVPARRDGVRSERINGENGAGRETLVGVIVYSRSPLSLAARNRATGGRYRVGRGLSAGRLVNEELRIVSRVVIVPNWRGLGLARRLVAETLPRVGTPYVEALAAMGRVHPFFEQAGMTAYPGAPGPAGSERLRSALEAVGLGRSARRSAEALEAALESLAPAARRLAEREIERWARSYLAAKNHRSRRPERRRTLDLVARHLDAAPVYYLWRRPDTQARGEGTNAREAPG